MMEHDAHLYYFNGSFDLELAGHSIEKYRHMFDEMTAWFIPVSQSDDRVVLDCTIPPDYLDYLASAGLNPGKPAVPGREYRGYAGTAWGWNASAVKRLAGSGAHLNHPAVETVARVNSRLFSHELSQIAEMGVKGGVLFHDPNRVIEWIERQTSFPWVVKPMHGNTGLGFIFIENPHPAPRQRERMEGLFHGHDGCVILEPWMNRTADISTRFELSERGGIGSLMHYRTNITPRGAFHGLILDPRDRGISPWKIPLDALARTVGRALHTAGYFGPVSIDSMLVAGVNGEPELVPLLEINARQGMSFIACTLREHLAPTRICLFRTIGTDQHRLPRTYDALRSSLGDLAFDPAVKTGILCVSPLRGSADENANQPHRSLFFIAAQTEDEMREMDKELTKIISPAKR